MIILTAEGIKKNYTEKKLLDGLDLYINTGEKIGLIGVNGTGKSTLLKILAGVTDPDAGTIVRGGGVRVGYLPQAPVYTKGRTVMEQVLLGLTGDQLQTAEYECRSILTKLGIFNFDQDVTTLSGGQKKRVAIASALVSKTELLILDEPTNHIDSEMVDWLEEALRKYRGALLMVTHDRYFLERVCGRIVELEGGKLYSYPGNYHEYLQLKEQRLEMEAASQRKRQSLLRQELAWMLQGPTARGTKSRYRIERYQEMAAQQTAGSAQKLEMATASSRLGRKILELEGLGYCIPERTLFSGFSYLLTRDDRLGILGPNGSGKSTLLKLMAGKLSPQEGTVTVGETVRIGYFSQEADEMDPAQRAIDYIRDIAPQVETPDGPMTAAQMMERFLFPGDLQYTAIGRLSGGERRRLGLLGVLMGSPNVLLLDEPTNDLDITTLTILEDYLDSFAGAVVVVSHDRYFLDRVVDHLFVLENAALVPCLGGYTDYLARQRTLEQEKAAAAAPAAEKAAAPRRKSDRLKFSFKEQREYEEIDGVIARLESSIAAKEAESAAAGSDFTRLQTLLAEKEELEESLAQQMERWVYLNDLAERIAQQEAERRS